MNYIELTKEIATNWADANGYHEDCQTECEAAFLDGVKHVNGELINLLEKCKLHLNWKYPKEADIVHDIEVMLSSFES